MRMTPDIATCMHDRKLQRALMQFFKPENYFAVRKALEQAGREDLTGAGCDALIPGEPPREALRARRDGANKSFRGEYVHTVPDRHKANAQQATGHGYRPGRKTAHRRPRRAGEK